MTTHNNTSALVTATGPEITEESNDPTTAAARTGGKGGVRGTLGCLGISEYGVP
jgi:hypothetical protein